MMPRREGRGLLAGAAAGLGAMVLSLLPGRAAAHQRWFLGDQGTALEPASVTDPGSLAAIAAALLVTAAVYALWRVTGRRSFVPDLPRLGADSERRAVLLGLLPVVLGLHTAVPLIVSGVQLQLFAPNLSVAEPGPVRLGSFLGAVVALGEIAVGLALVYGAFTRVAALFLALLWLIGLARFGPLLLLEQAIFLGIAAFLFIAGRGPFSVDAALSGHFGPFARLLPYAVPALRIGTGIGLASLALGEKLWHLGYAAAFVETYPINVLAAFGLPVSDRLFVLIAGAIELTAGLILVTGAFTREAIVVLWLPFNLTLAVFGWQELVGHLPVYGAMAVLLLWCGGKPDELAAFERGLRQRPVLAPEGPAADSTG